jgi:inosine-uridine nucleoside N-ribohydrolase
MLLIQKNNLVFIHFDNKETIMKYSALIILLLLLGISCQQAQEKPIKIILDTDMGSDCDDVGALALLHQFAKGGKAEILGCIYSSGRVPFGAGIIDAINRYYGRPDIPIGACQNNCIGDPVDKMKAEQLAKDTSAFHNKIIHNKDAIEQTKLNRRLLADQADGSVTYVTIGHTHGLYELLISKPDDISQLSGMELVKKKVNRWVALGALDANNDEGHYRQDWNFYRNDTAPFTEYIVQNFPNEIYFINAGSKVLTGASLEQTPKGNIVRDAYEVWLENTVNKKLSDQRPSWDLTTVYFAVEGFGEFLEAEETGWLDFDQKKGALWIKGENPQKSNHHYVNQKANVNDAFGDYLNARIVK